MTKATILQEILNHKYQEVLSRRKKCDVHQLQDMLLKHQRNGYSFIGALHSKMTQAQPAVIAEIKKASPSKGVLCEHFDPEFIANRYQQAGAACLSILTDEKYFMGHDDYLSRVRNISSLPILRKDFVVDEYQIYEAKWLGADCILLIVAALTDEKLQAFFSLATSLSLDVLVEVHDEAELDRALSIGGQLIGINNRNLHTFVTNIDTTLRLLPLIPEGKIVVSESGIYHHEQVQALMKHQVYGFLVGESFMRAKDPGAALQSLFST